jgi:hypothetical protein
MSENSLFGKVEALMRKHRGTNMDPSDSGPPATRLAPSPDAWLPVLTDVIRRGSPPPISPEVACEQDVVAEPVLSNPAEVFPAPLTEATPQSDQSVNQAGTLVVPSGTSLAVHASESVVDTAAEGEPDLQIAENLVQELAPKITGLMQEQVAEELRKSLNQSMTALMANLNANVEEIVRQAVAERLAEKDKNPT